MGLILGQFLALLLWSIPLRYLTEDDMYPKSLGPMLQTLAAIYMVHFFAQLLFKLENGHKYGIVIKLIGPLASCGLNYWRDG